MEQHIESPSECSELQYQKIVNAAFDIIQTSKVGPLVYVIDNDGVTHDAFHSWKEAYEKAQGGCLKLQGNVLANQAFGSLLNHLLMNNLKLIQHISDDQTAKAAGTK